MPPTSILSKARSFFKKDPNAVFRNVHGVIHVGANTGQEIGIYDRYGLKVVWIEPNPEVFETLKKNLDGFPKQTALKALVTDADDVEYPFHLANNSESSSILPMNMHHDIWPDVVYEKTITLRSATLSSLLKTNAIDLHGYDMLVMDTQGSELLVLKGALPILHGFSYIKTEVPDFESYQGCAQVRDLEVFLGRHGFEEHTRHRFARRRGGGSYFDIVYKRK